MEHFFYEDDFCSDLKDIAYILDIDSINDAYELKDDWQVKVELSNLEPIFDVNADDLLDMLAYRNEDRLTEDFREGEDALKALKECIDFDKLKDILPKLYYPNHKFDIITKQDLINLFN